MEQKIQCQYCNHERDIKEIVKVITAEGEKNGCVFCIEQKKLTYVYNTKEELINVIERNEAGKIIRKDLGINRDENSIYSSDEKTEKKCILCNRIKDKREVEKKICLECKKEKKKEGIIIVFDKRRRKINEISTLKKRKLIEKNIVREINENEVKVVHYFDKFFLSKKFRIIRKKIIVSKSGKWSSEATKKEFKELIETNIAEKINKKIARMNMNIEDFKAIIIKRDKRKCRFCGKKAHGVYSKSEVKTFSNSFCTCINCEYLMDPKKYLNWLNVIEKKPTLLDLFRKKAKKENVWIYEIQKRKKYRIGKEVAEKLHKEGMVEKINSDSFQLKYDVHSFRDFIINRENKKCHYCDKKGKTVDHVIPKSKGGLTTPENCVCACEKCNTKKGNTDKENFVSFLNQEAKETKI